MSRDRHLLAIAGLAAAWLIVAWSPYSGGPRVPSLILALLGAWWMYRQRATIWQYTAVRRFSALFLLLWIPILISVPDSLALRGSLNTAAALPAYYLAGVGMLVSLGAGTQRAWLRAGLAALLVVWIADGYLQYVRGRDLLGFPLTPDGRVTGFFADNLRLSWFVVLFLPVLIAYPRMRSIFAGAAVLVAAAILELLIGTRGALLGVLIVAVGWLARVPLVARLTLVAVLGAAIAGGTLLSPLSAERLARLEKLANPTFENLDQILSGRMTIWHTAFNMAKAHPWNGVGSGAFAASYDTYSTLRGDMFKSGGGYEGGPTHAHQMYVSVAAETGLIGLAGLIAAVSLCVLWYYRALEETRRRAWPYGMGLTAIAFPVQSQPVLFTHWWFPPMLLMVCALLAELEEP
jgi:O-antigen ligase